MPTKALPALVLTSLVFGAAQPIAAQDTSSRPSFDLLGTYTTGLADVAGQASAGETAALKYGRLYVTNALDVSLDIVNVLKPHEPRLFKRVYLNEYGSKVNSVDVSVLNLVAVAVEGKDKKTDPGKVVLLTPFGTVLRVVDVGAQPDMVTFTPDGKKLLVANEGEPDCYGDGCTDPQGTVSVITVLPWLPARPVKTVSFDGVALPDGVRIFGPGASPAQDLEPEYISVSSDSAKAYVTLQENNAIAEIHIASATVTQVHALGYKDLNQAPTVETHEINALPSIGSTVGGQELTLGGFSGLFYEGMSDTGSLKFVANTDRGPNGAPTGVKRPFLLPAFAPQVVRFELNRDGGEVTITQQIELKNADGTKLTGLPNTALGGTGSKPYDDEVPVDLFGAVLPLDPLGGDFEGIVVDADGSFWLPDEYRPAIYHFDPAGVLLSRYIPIGTHAAAGLAEPGPGVAGVLGVEALPAVLGQRRPNRGFEAIALQSGKIYAFVQSPLRNPVTLTNGALDVLKNIRVVEFDPATLATRQFLYVMDQPALIAATTDTRADKIGDAVALPGRGFLVIERDDDSAATGNPITKRIYAFDLTGATDITSKDTPYDVGGGVVKSLDQMSTTELALAVVNVKPVAKVLHLDLGSTSYNTVQKLEGLALIDANTLAVINDNDFGVAVIVIDPVTGAFTPGPGYTPEPTVLGLIQTHGLDASDRDNVINIRNWPVYGMYQPDGIASYAVAGQRLLVTANEGDARDYPGFKEDVRAKDVKGNYPAVPEVGVDAQLGRLTITTVPPAGAVRPYVFGTRSFSIWDATSGEQVWDSGTELEVLTAAQLPINFNSDHAANNFDNRSDNKGPEPEGIAIGRIGTHQYAFVGLERIGGVVVYDVTEPTQPEFVQYLVNRSFAADPVGQDSGPEVVRFVSALESPNGKPMLVVANEISGTVSLWGLGNAKPWWQQWRRIFGHD